MKKYLLVFATCLFLNSFVQGQNPGGGGVDNEPFSNYISSSEAYFESLTAQGIDITRLQTYKDYRRAVKIYSQVPGYPNFTIAELSEGFKTWYEENVDTWSCTINIYPLLNFEEVGPSHHAEMETDHPQYSNDAARTGGTGQIHFIEFDYSNFDSQTLSFPRMMACSGYGGLFETLNEGGEWFNAGTDKGLPYSAVSSMAFSPHDPSSTWYVTTGNAEFLTSGNHRYSIGIWKTTNAGQSYQNLTGSDATGVNVDHLKHATRNRKVISSQNGSGTRLIVASNGGLFVCHNADSPNIVWHKISDGMFYDVEFKPGNQNIIYACGDMDTPLIEYNFNTGIETPISDLNFNFDMPPNTVADPAEIVRRASIEFCGDLSDIMYVMITETCYGCELDGNPVPNINKDAELFRFDLTQPIGQQAFSLGVLSDDGQAGVGFERAMAWDVSPKLVNNEVLIVHGNVGKIRMYNDPLTNTPASWVVIENRQIHDDAHFLKFNWNGTELYVGNDGGVFHADMHAPGVTYPSYDWENLNKGLGVGTAYGLSVSQNGPEATLSSYQDMGSILSLKNGTNDWVEYDYVSPVGDASKEFIDYLDSRTMHTFTWNGTSYKTNDFWSPTYTSQGVVGAGSTDVTVEANSADHNIIYSCSNLGMRRSVNGGTYDEYSNLPGITGTHSGAQTIFHVVSSRNPRFSEYIYVAWIGGFYAPDGSQQQSRIYRSTVGGGLNQADWELVLDLEIPYELDNHGRMYPGIEIDYNDPDVIWYWSGKKIFKRNVVTGIEESYDQGLPSNQFGDFTIRDVEYVQGSNEALYMATDYGIYYRDQNTNDTWTHICGVPNTRVTDIEIDYCRSNIVASTYGRGVWESDIDLPKDKPFTVTNNYTMSGDFYPGTDVVVETGAELTITGTLYMPVGGRVIVKKGAKLFLNGGTITNGCGDLWQGVQVHGDKNLQQSATYQGNVIMTNGAKIEHAEIGVALWNPGDWNSTGGFIKASHCTFENNKKDVEFMNYSNVHTNGSVYKNISHFLDVNFTWTDEFRREQPLAHATLYKVDGVDFFGCTFNDERNLSQTDPNARGIISIDADYAVKGRCTIYAGCSGDIDDPGSGWDPTVFENLHIGIDATTGAGDQTINVDRCIFRDNHIGLNMVSLSGAVVVRNKFEFTDDPTHIYANLYMYGLHIMNSDHFKVEGNEFVREANSGAQIYGIAASDNGEQDEEIYRNTFTSLTISNYAQGVNRNSSGNGNEGLEFICNTHANNVYDHYVSDLFNYVYDPDNGVDGLTGSLTEDGGNNFTPASFPALTHFNNVSTNTITHWVGSSTTAHNIYMPISTGNNECLNTLPSDGKKVGIMSPFEKQTVISEFNDLTEQILLIEEEYNENLVDASELSEILSGILEMTRRNRDQVNALLWSHSPYLTTDIFFELADVSAEVYPHSWLKDLLIANIEAVTSDLYNYLRTKADPLPPNMIAEVAEAMQSSFTERLVLESEISSLKSKRSIKGNDLILDYKHDTIDNDDDSLIWWYENESDLLNQMNVIDIFLDNGDYSAANLKIDEFEATSENYSERIQVEISDFVALKRWQINYLREPGSLGSIEDPEFLQGLASDGHGKARYQARNILCFFFNDCPENEFESPSGGRGSFVFPNHEVDLIPDKLPISIYPNPANNEVTVQFDPSYLEDHDMIYITITDISGKIIDQAQILNSTYLWDSGVVAEGMYLITISSGENLLHREKVVIQR